MGELLKCAGGPDIGNNTVVIQCPQGGLITSERGGLNGSGNNGNGQATNAVESQGERVGYLLEREALDWAKYGTVFIRGHHVPKNGNANQHAFVVSTKDSRVIFDDI